MSQVEKKKIKTSIKIILIVVLVIPLSITSLLFIYNNFIRECPIDDILRIPSPDKKYEAVIVGRYCNPTSGYDTSLYLNLATRQDLTGAQTVLNETDIIITEKRWMSDDAFYISYEKSDLKYKLQVDMD